MSVQLTQEIEGIQTELLIQRYVDRLMVIVTQLGKVGMLIQATMPATAPLLPTASDSEDAQPEGESDAYSTLPQPPASIVLTPLLGATPNPHIHTLTNLYASQIATLAWHSDPSTRDPVVIGLALKRRDSESHDPTLAHEERQAYFSIMALVKSGLDRLQPPRP